MHCKSYRHWMKKIFPIVLFFKHPLQAALGVIEAWLGLEQEQNETFEL